MTIAALVFLLGLAVLAVLFFRHAQFGRGPGKAGRERLERSPHFKDGRFHNLTFTPNLVEGHTMRGIVYKRLFKRRPRFRPVNALPSVKTDLHSLPPGANVMVWFGHSSYFMQLDRRRFLVDPVFSGSASPVPGTMKAFKGTDIYTAADLPSIDYLLITHDHYDHVDYFTLRALRKKVGQVICGLGVGGHFERWGFPPERIVEKDWYERVALEDGFVVHVEPARHFSGRGFYRNTTLWVSYLLQTPHQKIYIGGDSGYDTHYASVGKRHGPVDLAILDNGQYDAAWRYIHQLPEEALQAARDLQAKRLFPVHSSKFGLANHAWDEPLVNIVELNRSFGIPLVTPLIGEPVNLDDPDQQFRAWWVGLS